MIRLLFRLLVSVVLTVAFLPILPWWIVVGIVAFVAIKMSA